MLKKKIAILGAAALLSVGTQAASVAGGYVDFTVNNLVTSGVFIDGPSAGVSWDLGVAGGTIYRDGVTGGTCEDLACVKDGIGIGDDEVTTGDTEWLTMTFGAPVTIQSLFFLDMFGDESASAIFKDAGGSSLGSITANASGGGGSGFLRYEVGSLGASVSSILLTAGPLNDNSGKADFAFAGLKVATPLPAAAWLFGSALLGFVAYSRRRFAG